VIVYVVSERAHGAEITSIVGVATSAEAGRRMAEKRHDSIPHPYGPLEWSPDDEASALWSGRRFTGLYQVEQFVVH
jgi:hypothetical protein